RLLDDVGASARTLDALGIGDAGERRARALGSEFCAAEQHGHAQAGNAGKQDKTTRGKTRLRSGNARGHFLSLHLQAAADRTARSLRRWSPLHYRGLEAKLNFGKVRRLVKAVIFQLFVLPNG